MVGVAGLVVLIIAVVLVLSACKRNEHERRESIAQDHDIVYGTLN
jgi:protein involved in sex pheromone biosynthesis